MTRSRSILAETDWLTIIIYLMLVLFGWMNIYSVNYSDGDIFFSLNNRYTFQMIWIGISISIAIMVLVIDSRLYAFIAYPAYILAIIILLAVILVGKEVNGSKSWIMFGPVGLQPAEFAKVATLLALAKFLSGFNVKPNSPKNIFISLGIIVGPTLLILMQPDFGSTLVYGSLILVLYREGLSGWIVLLILFMASIFLGALVFSKFVLLIILIATAFVIFTILNKGFKKSILGILILLAAMIPVYILQFFDFLPAGNFIFLFVSLLIATVVYLTFAFSKKIKWIFIIVLFLYVFIGFVFSVDFVFHNVLKKHQRDRVEIMLGLKSDPWGYEYNVNQSKIAIGSGGFTGRGFLKGPQTKLRYVPEQSTDFIFCTIGEEWGFLGSFAFVTLYIGLLIRLIIIAERQRSRFSRIYGYGVISVLFFHFAINVSMTLAIFPVIGIPLPFISYGGSALMAFTMMLFILLRLDSTRKAYLV